MCYLLVCEQKHEEYSDVKPQMTGNTIYKNNGVSRPGIVPEPLRLVETQSIPMAEGVQLNFRQPIETNQVTVSESYNVSGPHPPVTASIPLMTSEEIWQGRPSFSNVGPVHANTGGLSPGDDWKYEASHVNSRMDANITAAGASSDTFSSSSPSYVGDAQNAISANSLFSNQDPWSLRHDSHFPPPRPTKVPASKEAFVVKEETVIPQPSGHVHDLGSENTRSVKDEHIKQELQAVAEGVAASVLQSSTTSDLNGCGTFGPTSEAYQHREDNDGDEEARCTNQLEDGKSDLLEKMTPAFPFAENIGRLQIIKNSDLEELRELGSGTFGTVYHGKWRGSDVAIKRINDRCFSGKPSEQDRMRHDFWNEAIKLADLHHPNVVAFYGVVLDGPGGSVATVTEYMVNGSLRQALIRNDRTLDKRKRLLIAMDVAFGMEYLHGKNLVHFDLKSDNLLVNLRDPHRPICKVGDLGLSKLKCQTLISGGVRGTLPWMAPELLNGSRGIVNNTLRPPVPESCDPEWRALMERCWEAEPSERPSFTEIANQLRSMAASLPPKGQAQHNNSSQPQAQK
ncbi:hypothetical protein Syun_011197 [Stephania yunnanensis]|uniref:Protein kinase domain-containing protein n=1 Tax=Stephania yunnanensis TaxID=152371 RepID=A0AAP0JZH0_9MAGN